MTNAQLHTLPLLFSFTQVVVGNGFLAGVRMNGRALLEKEHVDGQEETWISGVAPVGIAGGGADRGAAFVEFRKAWTEVVFDIAEAARDFQEFKQSCVTFLQASQVDITKTWEDAVVAVRSRQYTDATLSTGSANKLVDFDVADLSHQMKTTSNQVDNGLQVAA